MSELVEAIPGLILVFLASSKIMDLTTRAYWFVKTYRYRHILNMGDAEAMEPWERIRAAQRERCLRN